MAYFNKAALLILNEKQEKFLVCEKNHFTSDFIMPGGRFEQGEDDVMCLRRELAEELDVKLDEESLEFVGEYVDVAAGDPTKDVSIRLYKGNVVGTPVPSQEIIGIVWLGKEDLDNPRLSPIIRNKIMPDIITRGILK